jgi:hypothetical protein
LSILSSDFKAFYRRARRDRRQTTEVRCFFSKRKGQPFVGWPVKHIILSDLEEALFLCLLEAAPNDFPALGTVPDETRVVAAARQADSHVAVEARTVTRAVAEARRAGPHAAAEARRAGPEEAAHCVACPDGIAAEVAAGSLADVLAVRVSSAESPADARAVAVSSAEIPEADYFRIEIVVVLAGDCSPAVCPGTGEAAAPAELQMAGGEHCDCWAQERYDSPVRQGDRCPQECCGFLEEQAEYKGRRAE